MTDMDSSLLVSESVFLKISNGDLSHECINFHDSIEDLREELKSLSWDQLIELDNDKGFSSTMDETSGPVHMTKSEALKLLNIAATLLQRNIRRYFQQRKYQHFLKVYKAAVKIQTAWRGYRTRNLDVCVLQLKHDYIISKLQNKIDDMDNYYKHKIDYLHQDKQLMTQIISLLYKEIESLKPSFSRLGTISSSHEKRDNDPLTPTNSNQGSFFVNNPHLIPIISSVSLSSSTSVVLYSDTGMDTQVMSTKEDVIDTWSEIIKSKDVSILSLVNDNVLPFNVELSRDKAQEASAEQEYINSSSQNQADCLQMIEEMKNGISFIEKENDNDICTEVDHFSELVTDAKTISEMGYMRENDLQRDSIMENIKESFVKNNSIDAADDQTLVNSERENVKDVFTEKKCLNLSVSNTAKPSLSNIESSMDTTEEKESVLTFIEIRRNSKTIAPVESNSKSTESEDEELESNTLFLHASDKDFTKGDVATIVTIPVHDEKDVEFVNVLNLIQADSFEFINDSLQVDDSYDNDAASSSYTDNTESLFSVNVVVNGQAVQQDSVPINPIEADCLQFIEDSLQVD